MERTSAVYGKYASARSPLNPVLGGPKGEMRGFLVVAALLTTACGRLGNSRTPCVYEIPEGYRGWVLIQYSKTTCPPIAERDGKLVFPIPSKGYLCTSTPFETGWARDEFIFVGTSRVPIEATAPGAGGLIWRGSNGSCGYTGGPKVVMSQFYVGTEDAARKAGEEPSPPDCESS